VCLLHFDWFAPTCICPLLTFSGLSAIPSGGAAAIWEEPIFEYSAAFDAAEVRGRLDKRNSLNF
jgi:hypothetical protein